MTDFSPKIYATAMIKHQKTIFFFILFLSICIVACRQNNSASDEEQAIEATTPVTITNISIGNVSETIELNAISTFQKKNMVKATAIGYIDSVTVNIGDEVVIDQLLFTIKTKEASAFENPIIKDNSLSFSGLVKIKAPKSGILSALDHHKGDYVQDGDQLGAISERSSLVFLLEVPFELHNYMKVNSDCEIFLPDSMVIKGKVSAALSSMDPVSQTQSFVVRPIYDTKLPENLIAKISIVKNVKAMARLLPKPAVLSDETQTEFWVMKLINDSIAVKVPVKKGMETQYKIEILDPVFSESDRIVISGNYDLADTAKVNIVK